MTTTPQHQPAKEVASVLPSLQLGSSEISLLQQEVSRGGDGGPLPIVASVISRPRAGVGHLSDLPGRVRFWRRTHGRPVHRTAQGPCRLPACAAHLPTSPSEYCILGAFDELVLSRAGRWLDTASTCPSCRFALPVDPAVDPLKGSSSPAEAGGGGGGAGSARAAIECAELVRPSQIAFQDRRSRRSLFIITPRVAGAARRARA